MKLELYHRINQVKETLISQGQRPTVSKIITQSLFSTGGTLAGHAVEINQVLTGFKESDTDEMKLQRLKERYHLSTGRNAYKLGAQIRELKSKINPQ